jgi:sarcosine oxidase subunit alpha
VAAGRRLAVLTNNDGGHSVARRLVELGLTVAAVIDPRAASTAAAGTVARGIPVHAGHVVAEAEGRRTLWGLRLATVAGDPGPRLDVDTLAVAGGWTPLVQLASQAGARPVWDETRQTFLPGPLPAGWRAIGSCAGEALPAVAPLQEMLLPRRRKAFVDLQNDVTAEDVHLAVREGFGSVEHLKRYTTLGMATDQGRTSSVNGLAILAAARGAPIAELGTTRFRPPVAPVALGALAGRSIGAHLRPERRTPMHDWHLAHGAEMYETGLWLRPRAYLRGGETVATAYVREAKAVRAAVGIVDVSTLGKIDVQGPDAAAFLDRVYCNAMAGLPVGKARYGLMLREDGMVLDDGTAWRLAADRFLVTTTTANAAPVLSHLEHLLAVVWPELRVVVTSVTDQWAAMAVAGPRSREVLARALGEVEMSHEAFPPMGVRAARCGAVPVLVARLSFSGERAYEVFAPWTEGEAVWRRVLAAGEPLGIVPYGLEAMGALRIEKGHVAGPELDGRTTPGDLGLDRMVSRRKSFIGSAMLDRPGLTHERRLRLVGLLAVDRRPIRAGAHLVAGADLAKPGRSLGHVTSWTWSPALGRYAALGLLEGGLRHEGRRLWATFPLRREHVPVEVVHPCLYDPEGTRLDG